MSVSAPPPADDDRPVPGTDAYEAKYMEGGRSLFRSKMRMPGWFFALLGGVMAVSVAGGIAGALKGPSLVALIAPVLSFVMLSATALLFSHLRVVLTATHLHVQFGVFGPSIALSQIESCVAEEYRALDYGGWGLRYAGDSTWAYSVPGAGGRAIRVVYRTAEGKRKTAVVTSTEADVLASAVNRARGGLSGGGVRIEAADEAPAVVEAESTGESEASRQSRRG